jgi:hypothetical protein
VHRLSHQDRDLVTDMALGEHTLDLARRYGLSPATVSHRRRVFEADWTRFTADPADPAKTTPRCAHCC